MDELRRILGGTNPRYIDETKKRWENFCANAQFYGVWKKVLKPPIPLNMRGGMLQFFSKSEPCKTTVILQLPICVYGTSDTQVLIYPLMPLPVDFTIAFLTGLPSLFPSPTLPPKRLGNPSEALLHVLQVRLLCISVTI